MSYPWLRYLSSSSQLSSTLLLEPQQLSNLVDAISPNTIYLFVFLRFEFCNFSSLFRLFLHYAILEEYIRCIIFSLCFDFGNWCHFIRTLLLFLGGFAICVWIRHSSRNRVKRIKLNYFWVPIWMKVSEILDKLSFWGKNARALSDDGVETFFWSESHAARGTPRIVLDFVG